MELYQNNPKIKRNFLTFLPKLVIGSTAKDCGYSEKTAYEALSKDNYIRFNSPDLVSALIVDIDDHKDGGIWLDYDLPQPTWTVWTRRGVQFGWVLNKPILAKVAQHRKMLREVIARLYYALGGDIHTMNWHRVFRNPINNRSVITDTRVDLSDFFDLPKPDQGWWDKVKAKNSKPKATKKRQVLDEEKETQILDNRDFANMTEGDGRNEALFNRLRFWAYDQAKAGTYSEFDLAEQAHKLNQIFGEPMLEKEVEYTIKSIDEFIEFKYTGKYAGGDYMSEEQIKERASKAGKQSAKLKTAEARGRILAVLNQYESWERKITISGIAKDAKAHKNTVSEYLKELGYSNKGGSIGWKK